MRRALPPKLGLLTSQNAALQDEPLYAKARHRRALANEEIGTWGSLQSSLEGPPSALLPSLVDLTRRPDYNLLSTSAMLPRSMRPSIDAARARLPARIAEQSEKEKAEMMGKLKELGNSFLGMFGMSTDNFKMEKGDDGGYRVNMQR